MSKNRTTDGSTSGVPVIRPNFEWKRLVVILGIPAGLGLLILILLWNIFFVYVPPGKMLVITSNMGKELQPDQMLADAGQKGIQKGVLGEGYHYITPILYSTQLMDCVKIPAGKVGIVTSLNGIPPREGDMAQKDDEKGIRRQVLPPGTYRLNPYAFKVEQVDATEIRPGYVGVSRRLRGKENKGIFAENEGEKGILRHVLQPGLYFVNTQEYEVLIREVGVYQTSYHFDPKGKKDTSLELPVKDSRTIRMDCTVEWELRPDNAPEMASRYRTLADIERNVIDRQVRGIGRSLGFDYSSEDWLDGSRREKFQDEFRKKLEEACNKEMVKVNSAYIRSIIIPDIVLEPKRRTQLAIETTVTNEAKNKLAISDAAVKEEFTKIEQSVKNVMAETEKMVALVEREMENVNQQTEAELERIKAKFIPQMADLEAQRTLVMAEAETTATKLKETAKSNIYKLKLEVFQNDPSAFQRYTLAQQLNPQLRLRLFHSGPGTFWTNLEGKSMNLMISPPTQAPTIVRENKPATGETIKPMPIDK